jgi:hypothetical protein
MATAGVITDGSTISLGETFGSFYVVKSRQHSDRILSVLIEVDSDSPEKKSIKEFVAFALNKKTNQLTAEDYDLLIISGQSWSDFRKAYIKERWKVKMRSDCYLIATRLFENL